MRMGTLATLLAAFLLAAPHRPVLAADLVVGGSAWCIPPNPGLYRAWADNRTIYVGDTLIFRFETGSYDVVQVGRREYEDCTADDPYQIFRDGPAAILLDHTGLRYYIVCTIGNHCSLGVKMYVTVQPR